MGKTLVLERGKKGENLFFRPQKWIREHKEDYRGDRVEDFQDKYLQKVFAGEKHFNGDGGSTDKFQPL